MCFVIFSLSTLCNCTGKKKDPEFYYSKTLEWDFARLDSINGKTSYKREIILIRNAQDYTNQELLVFIQKYEKQILVDTAYLFEKYDQFYRCYYRESKKTPINFVEDPGGFVVDILEDHKDDYVCCLESYKNRHTDTIIFDKSNDCKCD